MAAKQSLSRSHRLCLSLSLSSRSLSHRRGHTKHNGPPRTLRLSSDLAVCLLFFLLRRLFRCRSSKTLRYLYAFFLIWPAFRYASPPLRSHRCIHRTKTIIKDTFRTNMLFSPAVLVIFHSFYSRRQLISSKIYLYLISCSYVNKTNDKRLFWFLFSVVIKLCQVFFSVNEQGELTSLWPFKVLLMVAMTRWRWR